ncbi:putative acetyltransferase [Cohaesibacter marisflavi]|uniref:Putative acetyltransferase n=1 Tax=Cohaesibacter marisflavi TaxID=655353 RepID=A0A1I5MZD8_9HYPH|nr:N-acetyltransferase [Cohaesibacter marisflavi]SFP14840.1 putative acetyltransferase [Cohaesibacter marisflavi]
MDFSVNADGANEQIVNLFSATFTASEGADEGDLIGTLVSNLLGSTQPHDIYVFTAIDDGEIVGGAIFTRLLYADDARSVYILSPMAVATNRQGEGVGQALLNHALAVLRDDGVAVAITYGDPTFYGKVGFLPLDEDTAASPLPLSVPVGWVGQSLTDKPLLPLKGKCTCVSALNDPAIW